MCDSLQTLPSNRVKRLCRLAGCKMDNQWCEWDKCTLLSVETCDKLQIPIVLYSSKWVESNYNKEKKIILLKNSRGLSHL